MNRARGDTHRRVGADPSADAQTVIGLSLAAAIIGAWLVLHVYGVFFLRLTWASAPWAVAIIAVQTWLATGMFIVAHDAMHGSLAPGRPRLNAVVGQAALGLYAAFPYRRMARKHHAHHRHVGTEGDPDFDALHPRAFWPWYLKFFTEYFGWGQLAVIGAVYSTYVLILHAGLANAFLFGAFPAIAASLQLFTFGTWLPHRHDARGEAGFVDGHRARTQDFGWWLSLITCFHFGYHLEHHHAPGAPWWSLPRHRREARFIPR